MRKPVNIQSKVRLPQSLHRRLAAAALIAERSMNSEIIERLNRSFTSEDRRQDEINLRQIIREELSAALDQRLAENADA